MGVVKNLMVRVGADLSGLVSGFKQAGGATGSFQQKAAKDLTSLKSSLSQMREGYTSISDAAKDIDLTKSVSKQIKESSKDLGTLEQKAADLENQLAFWSEVEPTGMQYKTQEVREALASLDSQIDGLYYKLQRLEHVKGLGESLGIKDVTYSSLNGLQMQIASTEDELCRMESAADNAAEETKDLGNAAKASGVKVKTASSWIGGLRKNAKSSSISLSDLTKSLRNVGVVAVGVKLAGAVLGEFRSLITGYISQNEALQARVDELKAGFGQALAPAINVATNALSAMMPYILGVSNAIGELLTNLFGTGWAKMAEGSAAAAAAAGDAATAQDEYNRTLAGFDKITKLGSGKDSGSSAPESLATAAEISIPSWMSDLPTKLRDSIKVGDYKGVGSAIADALSSAVESISKDGQSLGASIAKVIQSGVDAVAGFVEDLDWTLLGASIKTNIQDLYAGINWASIYKAIGTTAGGILDAIWAAIGEGLSSAWEKLQSDTAKAGGDILAGILIGVVDGVVNIGKWIKDNIFVPFIEGFKNVFDIHSPSQNKEIVSLGTNIIGGVLNGTISALKNIGAWIKDNVFTPVSNAFKSAFANSFSLQGLLDLTGSVVTVGVSLAKKGWTSLKSFVGSSLSVATSLAKKGWTSLKAFVGSSLSVATSLTKKGWSSLSDFVGSKLSVATSLIKSGWTSLSGFVGSALTISTSLKKGWTGSIAKALGLESITSKLDLKLPKISIDWGSVSVLGKTFSYPKGFDIKWNAKGAILNGAQLFGRVGNTWLGGGEAGREALLPLDRNTGWMDKIADRVASRVSSGGAGAQNLVVYLTLDGKVVTKTVIRNINAQAKSTGKNPLAAYI